MVYSISPLPFCLAYQIPAHPLNALHFEGKLHHWKDLGKLDFQQLPKIAMKPTKKYRSDKYPIGKFIIGDIQEQVAGFTALPRLVIDSSGYVGINISTPQALLDISGVINSGYAGINTLGTITLANNNPNHKIRLVTTSAASYIQSDISGRIEGGLSLGTGVGNNLHFSRWNGSGIAMTVDTSGGRVGIGTTNADMSSDKEGILS